MRMRNFWAGVPLLVVACGGRLAGDDGGLDASTDSGMDGEAGYTACSTPEGFRICGTPACSNNDPSCGACASNDQNRIGICGTTLVDNPLLQRGCDQWCPDGSICVELFLGEIYYRCGPYSLGVLLEKYSPDSTIARYADLSAWTGDSLPEPNTCPASAGYQLCGGACSPCPVGDICAGRSPLHPWGVCVPDSPPPDQEHTIDDAGTFDGPTTCAGDAGEAVFVFKVDSPSQSTAAKYGRCMPLAMCQALAATYPGGGACTGP